MKIQMMLKKILNQKNKKLVPVDAYLADYD